MFRGHAQRTQDPKGRLMLPPEFRDEVLAQSPDGSLMLTNFDDCIAAYPMPEWLVIEQSFSKLNMANRRFRDFHRFFIAWRGWGANSRSGTGSGSRPSSRPCRTILTRSWTTWPPTVLNCDSDLEPYE